MNDRQSRVLLDIAEGTIEGTVAGGVERFANIPSAAPVTAANRFKEAQPPLP